MEPTEEAETKGSTAPPPADTAGAAAETEGDAVEQERYYREIKADLHPLKVPSLPLVPFFFFIMSFISSDLV